MVCRNIQWYWVLFGTYYYNKLQYFTLSQKKHYADKPCNTGIYDILQQDTNYERLDSIPVRVTRIFISKPRKIGGLLIFIYREKQPLGLIWDLSYLAAAYPVLWQTMFLWGILSSMSMHLVWLVKLRALATASQALIWFSRNIWLYRFKVFHISKGHIILNSPKTA